MALASWQTVVFALWLISVEIITGVGRHRSWSSEEKVRLVGEVAERGVAEVARRYEVCRSLLYRWRRQMRRGELATTAGRAAAARRHRRRQAASRRHLPGAADRAGSQAAG